LEAGGGKNKPGVAKVRGQQPVRSGRQDQVGGRNGGGGRVDNKNQPQKEFRGGNTRKNGDGGTGELDKQAPAPDLGTEIILASVGKKINGTLVNHTGEVKVQGCKY